MTRQTVDYATGANAWLVYTAHKTTGGRGLARPEKACWRSRRNSLDGRLAPSCPAYKPDKLAG